MKTLREIPCGKNAKVVKLTGEGPTRRRIMDMGITKGVDIFVRKTSSAWRSSRELPYVVMSCQFEK